MNDYAIVIEVAAFEQELSGPPRVEHAVGC